MLASFNRLSHVTRNFLIGLVTIIATIPFYVVPNIIFGERPGVSLATFADAAIPFAPWTITGYAMIYVFIFLPFFTIRDRTIFRRIQWGFILCSAIALPFFIFFPVRMPRPGIPTQESLFYWGVAFNYVLDKPVNCFPSMHVANSVFAALCTLKLSPRVGLWGLIGSLYIIISTTTLRQHFIADVVAGAAVAVGVYYLMVHPVIMRSLEKRKREELIFPPQSALWVVYLYMAFVSACLVLFISGLRFDPVLPVN